MNCPELKCNSITIDRNCNLCFEDNTFNYKYIQVFILKHFRSSTTETLVKEERETPVIFHLNKDGFYTLCKLTIPVNEAAPYYYKDGHYYHNILEITLQNIINTSPLVSGVKFEYFYLFALCNLKQCFINICKDIFNLTSSICKPCLDNTLIYKRDLLWATLNVIQYNLDMDLFEEAQRLLELITSCGSLCPETNNCGCNNE